MSQNDNESVLSKDFLTERTVCPGQTQEGRFNKNCRIDHHDMFVFALTQMRRHNDMDEYLELLICKQCKKCVRYPENWATHDEFNEYFTQIEKEMEATWRRIEEKRKTAGKSHRGYELGAREFTLSYSPKWMDDNTARLEMTKAMTKLLKYYEDEIIELRAVGEVGTNGLSHIHCFYKLVGGVKITDKNFKRAWKYWNPKKRLGNGFEGGHHQTVRQESDFRGYIEKDIDEAWYQITRNRPA